MYASLASIRAVSASSVPVSFYGDPNHHQTVARRQTICHPVTVPILFGAVSIHGDHLAMPEAPVKMFSLKASVRVFLLAFQA